MWLCGCSDNNARVGSYENNISVYFVHTVPHIRQEKSYDCGLACFKMALSWCLENKPSKEELETLISKQSFETSIWTIDLVYMLSQLGVSFKFFTIHFGVDISYKNDAYYAKRFNKEESRVNALFLSCVALGLPIFKKDVLMTEIIQHLKSYQIAIVLVSASKLNCRICYKKIYKLYLRLSESRYCGHYVVLVGCIDSSRDILYRDPAFSNRLCIMSYETLQKARSATGTDKDIIFLYSNKPVKL